MSQLDRVYNYEINSVWAVITMCPVNESYEKLFNFFDRSYKVIQSIFIEVLY